jgi:capsular exopolysaccharide synthesis family protein
VELIDYWAVLKARWLSIVLVTVAGLAVGVGVFVSTPAQYRATADTLLTVAQGDSPGELVSGSTFTQSQVESFALIATSARVLEPALDALGLDLPVEAFAGRVSAHVPVGTAIVSVVASAATPELAARTADAVSAALVQAVDDMTPSTREGVKLVQATVISPALLPRAPAAPSRNRLLAAGGIVGLAVGYVQGLVRTVVGRRIRGERDVERVVDAPVIGSVRFDPEPVPAAWVDDARRAQDYRAIVARLEFLRADRGRLVVAVTSAVPGAGKSTVSLNLAALLAGSGTDTLLVDADLRRPNLAHWFSEDGSVGLSGVLVGRGNLLEAVRPTSIGHLYVLSSGPPPPDPAETLLRAAAVFQEAKQRYGYVIVDSPALLGHPDASIVVKLIGEAILVAAVGSTTRAQLGRAVGAVDQVFGTVRGVVLNQARPGRGRSKAWVGHDV